MLYPACCMCLMTSKCCRLFLIIVFNAYDNARFVFIETEDGTDKKFDSNEECEWNTQLNFKYIYICSVLEHCKDVNGVRHNEGDSYSDGCNSCSCGATPEGTSCTRRPYPPCDIEKKCVDSQGNKHRPGQKFKEDCNNCYCYKDGFATCTRIGCGFPIFHVK